MNKNNLHKNFYFPKIILYETYPSNNYYMIYIYAKRYIFIFVCLYRSSNCVITSFEMPQKTCWHRLISAQFPIIYLYTLFLTYWGRKFKVKLMC